MLNKLNDKILSLWVNVQANAYALAHGGQETAVQSASKSRLQMGAGAFLGASVLFATNALAQTGSNSSRDKVTSLIQSVTTFILILVAFAVVCMTAIGAFLFITSAGNARRVGMARDTIKNVFIGLAVAAAIYLLRNIVLDLLGGVDKTSKTDIGECIKGVGVNDTKASSCFGRGR